MRQGVSEMGPRKAPEGSAPHTHLVVAAGILPAAEPGVPPGGKTHIRPGRPNYLRSGGKMPPATAGGTPAATEKPVRPRGRLDAYKVQRGLAHFRTLRELPQASTHVALL